MHSPGECLWRYALALHYSKKSAFSATFLLRAPAIAEWENLAGDAYTWVTRTRENDIFEGSRARVGDANAWVTRTRESAIFEDHPW